MQGIILVAVAFAHGQRNEALIGIRMLKRALEKLGASPSKYHAIDVDMIRERASDMRTQKRLALFEM